MDMLQYRLTQEFSVIHNIVCQLASIKAIVREIEADEINFKPYLEDLPDGVSPRLLFYLADRQEERLYTIGQLKKLEANLSTDLRQASSNLGRLVRSLRNS
ncbi:MAG: hypothetical protein C4575_01350 [Desulforudis sp.]|nr:MAG: hypothetical protein C4575_01350 [Desulforudis sp.]